MKVKDNYSKRDYTKKIYWSGDKKDLRKSFPKWTMIAWGIIDIACVVLLYQFENIFAQIAAVFFCIMAYTHLSYLWGGKIWGPSKKEKND